ncbi:MAG: copper resistance protein, partial [Kribbellaceae bacterium]|nr:copper resistance protein [Kribbellaceae bacterium]
MRRLLALLAASFAVLVVSTGTAAAHAKLESMTPADGSTQAVPPTQVVLTFNEPVGSTGAEVQV